MLDPFVLFYNPSCTSTELWSRRLVDLNGNNKAPFLQLFCSVINVDYANKMPPHFKRDKIQKNDIKDKCIIFIKNTYINNKTSSNIISILSDKSIASQNYLRY